MNSYFRWYTHFFHFFLLLACAGLFSMPVAVAAIDIADTPLFLGGNGTPLIMLVMGRDHKLYYEAYNDASDLNQDGEIDVGYKPNLTQDGKPLNYFGYFDSYKCYHYDLAGEIFIPVAVTTNKKCISNWSGDFLNYLTTSRIDALRRILYGGKRYVDNATETVLERSRIPQDAHSWGKEYESITHDGYDIREYAPLVLPATGTRHLFANTTLQADPNQKTLLRVLQNSTYRIWEWVAIERPVAGDKCINQSTNCVIGAATRNDLVVRVKACVSGLLEPECKGYPTGSPTGYKPTGLVHEYGEANRMAFGLLTGSYKKHMSGGILRKNVKSFTDEVDSSTGKFITPATAGSIVGTIDKLQIVGFRGSFSYNDGNCDVPMVTAMQEGRCAMWGNPIAEMIYESMRYFSGQPAPTSAYDFTAGTEFAAFNAADNLNLPKPAWSDPYLPTAQNGGGYPYCSKPFQVVIADAPSFDTDQLPGVDSNFGSGISSDIGTGTLNVANLGQIIWDNEEGGAKNIFIGESRSNTPPYDTAPTPKTVTSFGNIRGLAPEEPTRQGGYYAGSLAYFGRTTGIRTITTSTGPHVVKTDTFGVALSSPLPKIEIPVPNYTSVNKKIITVVPFAKSVGGSGINAASGQFQPTNTIVDFFVETIANTGAGNADASINGGRPYIKFRINYEDSEYGSDHDMDAIVTYTFTVNASNQLEINLKSDYEAGGVLHHIGYVISGTTKDGVYLEVRDWNAGSPGNGNPSGDVSYFLDTPPAFTGTPPAPNSGVGTWNDGVALPVNTTRTFAPATAATTTATFIPHDPLWYAAKWGGFIDKNGDQLPQTGEWDSKTAGKPDSYFLVTNAGKLKEQLGAALQEIVARTSSAAAVAVNSGSLNAGTRLYQARFNSQDWSGQLLAFPLGAGGATLTQEWDAGVVTLAQGSSGRNIITFKPSTQTGIAFTWPTNPASPGSTDLDASQVNALTPPPTGSPLVYNYAKGQAILNYLRGDASNEVNVNGAQVGTYAFRKRSSGLGDIVYSNPVYQALPNLRYRDTLESVAYSSFRLSNLNRRPMLYVGANDGMLHMFDAATGKELLAYVPSAIFGKLADLSLLSYNNSHHFYVDGSPIVGDAFWSGAWHSVLVGRLGAGGQSVFALDVTNPGAKGSTTDFGNFLQSNASSLALWEFTDANDGDLGYTLGQAAVAKLNNDQWAAVFGNGYNSDSSTTIEGTTDTHVGTGHGVLFIVDATKPATGSAPTVIKKIDTGSAGGLSTPYPYDVDGDNKVDWFYAGDLQGNLWKFDVRDSNPANWTVHLLFVATVTKTDPVTHVTTTTRQPITTSPITIEHPQGGVMVLFGTGKYLGQTDTISTDPQTYYGIWDKEQLKHEANGTWTQTASFSPVVFPPTTCHTLPTSSSDPTCKLQLQAFTGSVTLNGQTYRTNSTNAVVWEDNAGVGKRGWYIDLPAPRERVIGDSIISDGRLIFTSNAPDSDPCAFGGLSWLNLLDALTGQRVDESASFIGSNGQSLTVTNPNAGATTTTTTTTTNAITAGSAITGSTVTGGTTTITGGTITTDANGNFSITGGTATITGATITTTSTSGGVTTVTTTTGGTITTTGGTITGTTTSGGTTIATSGGTTTTSGGTTTTTGSTITTSGGSTTISGGTVTGSSGTTTTTTTTTVDPNAISPASVQSTSISSSPTPLKGQGQIYIYTSRSDATTSVVPIRDLGGRQSWRQIDLQ